MIALRLAPWSILFTLFVALDGCGGQSSGSSTLGAVCGGESGKNCATGEYCAHEPGTDCGRAGATATCKARPEVCSEIYAPVCGCDGKTYPNACAAAGAGVGYEKDGACDGGTMCAGIAGLSCPEEQFCFMDVGACLIADASGVCRDTPHACTKEYAPVCGCDHKTYGNACSAAAAGVNVASEGPC